MWRLKFWYPKQYLYKQNGERATRLSVSIQLPQMFFGFLWKDGNTWRKCEAPVSFPLSMKACRKPPIFKLNLISLVWVIVLLCTYIEPLIVPTLSLSLYLHWAFRTQISIPSLDLVSQLSQCPVTMNHLNQV